MTNPIEQEFYKAFRIKPKIYYRCKFDEAWLEACSKDTCEGCSDADVIYEYPSITDHRLLELLVLASKTGESLYFDSIADIKECVLNALTNFKGVDWAYDEVRKIMGVEE